MQEVTEAKARKQVRWRQRLERFAACGLPVKEFCKTESIMDIEETAVLYETAVFWFGAFGLHAWRWTQTELL